MQADMSKRVLLALIAWLCCSLSIQAADTTRLYVSPDGDDYSRGTAEQPVKSLSKALEILRTTSGDREIQLAGNSLLPLTQPIRLDARDSRLRVVGNGATLSGGVSVTDWKAGGDGIWRAKCPVEGRLRELFINGQRAVRARFPNDGWLRVNQTLPDRRSGFSYVDGDLLDSIQTSHELELVFLHDWSISRLPITSVDRESQILRTEYPIGSSAPHFAIDHFEEHPRFALEGTRELIDAPGEWCLSNGEILYRPRDGETLETLSATVPYLRQLLEIAPGDDGRVPSNMLFEGVTFAHCRWELPREGYVSVQATMHDARDGFRGSGQPFIPAAVRVTGASNIVFANCSFAHLGCSGLWIGQGARTCVVDGCEFADISGNGINVGEPDTKTISNQIATGIEVRDSLVNDCGTQYYGSVGIWIGMAQNCAVRRCEIRQLPYTGISVGWRWNSAPSPCKGHLITENNIHHVLQVLCDGGGIYTLGRQPGTVLSENDIHDVPLNAGRAQSNGIFMDEGTTGLMVEGNKIYAIAKSPMRFHRAGPNTIRNNTMSVSKDVPVFTYDSTDPRVMHFERNTVNGRKYDPAD